MGFTEILKSATTRNQIVAAIEQQAEKIAKRENCSMDLARAKAWQEHPEAHEAYERTSGRLACGTEGVVGRMSEPLDILKTLDSMAAKLKA
jgi:hypothetical protein